jgi:hypothetical protein
MHGISAIAALAAIVFAQAAPAAWDALVQHGVELRLAGKEEAALRVLQEAAHIQTSPRILAQMAFCEQSLGYWRLAESHLRTALESAGDRWVLDHRKALDEARAVIGQHLGSLELRGSEGHLFIDGHDEGTLPHEGAIRLEIGRHRIEVRREGTYPFLRDVDITSDNPARESVVLAPLPTVKPNVERERPDERILPTPPAPRQHPYSVVGWTLVGGSAAAATLGIVALVTSNQRAHDYNADPTCTGHSDEPRSCTSSASASRDWRVVSIASIAGATALAAAGIVGIVWTPKASATRVQITPTGAVFTRTF